jgi:hypothetical protein
MRTALEQSRLDEPLKFPPVGNFSNRDIGNLGTVIHETARELARVRLTFFSTQQQPHCNENPFYVFPEKGIARSQSRFPHSCVCERFVYYQDRSTFFPVE